MPQRFEGLHRLDPSTEQNGSIGLFEDEISRPNRDDQTRHRDKCSRGFSDFQYFTKEISSEKPELVGHFLILDRISLRLTERCKSEPLTNPMEMNKLSQYRFSATSPRASSVQTERPMSDDSPTSWQSLR